MVLFTDSLMLDAPRKVGGGYMAVRARAARTGVYEYAGREIDPDNAHGLRDERSVNVLRDESTVFDERAVRTFIGKPVTDDHPREAVTRDNWRDHGRGVIMGAMRDGDHLAFDLLLMDGPTIDKVDAGKRQLSNGYAADIEFGDFTAPDGTKCQARQSRISDGNHVAIVDAARGGASCRIGDAKPCEAAPSALLTTLADSLTTQEKPVKTMLIDGLTVDIANADTAHATITTILAARDGAMAKVTGLETQVATLTTDKATLEAEVKKLTDAKPTPTQLRDAAKQFAIVVDKAKALGITVTDAMGEDEIKKAAVLKHVGDAAKDWSAQMIDASFATLKDAKADALRTAIADGVTPIVTDSRTFYEDSRARQRSDLSQAWRGAPKTEAAA